MYNPEMIVKAGIETAEKKPIVFYFCDRKKCGDSCYRQCLHTSDPDHALDMVGFKFRYSPFARAYVQVYDESVDIGYSSLRQMGVID